VPRIAGYARPIEVGDGEIDSVKPAAVANDPICGVEVAKDREASIESSCVNIRPTAGKERLMAELAPE
jgi:hypothetical protein